MLNDLATLDLSAEELSDVGSYNHSAVQANLAYLFMRFNPAWSDS